MKTRYRYQRMRRTADLRKQSILKAGKEAWPKVEWLFTAIGFDFEPKIDNPAAWRKRMGLE